jgi:predicted nucleic acid-binding protein
VLLDTGPLIALLDDRDGHHAWAKLQFGQLAVPLFTCEAVLTEACFLAQRMSPRADEVLGLFERGVVELAFDLHGEFDQVAGLMRRYANLPMSLADACLVRMSELTADCVVLTLDGDFRIYRRHVRKSIPLLMPPTE